MIDQCELLAALEEGLGHGRISPQTAALMVAELLGIEAHETGYQEWELLATAEANESELALVVA